MIEHRPPRTRRGKARSTAETGPSFIAHLPLGVWRIPPCRWVLSLRKHDGCKEVRIVGGDLLQARERRDTLMKTGRYTMAWLIEAQEDRRGYGSKKKVKAHRGDLEP